jgi:hypothetical protein
MLPWCFPEQELKNQGQQMAGQRITKRVVDGLKPRTREHAVWDAQLPGFGVRVRPTGSMSYVVVYRAGAGRGAPVRRFYLLP